MADIEMTPITRKEFYLAGITGMDVQAPSPVTRLESYLNDILNGTVSQLTPLNRVECYLAKISGADVTIPVPMTRLEVYLAAIAGMDIDVPDPVTREEHWLWQWANAGPGGLVETVTGTLPLTLANAISHAIVSLTRYGLCTQDGTPTPNAPVDIMTNNGALKFGWYDIITTSALSGYGTYVSPSGTAGNRAYKWFKDLPNGTYTFAVDGDYEIIVQWRDPADPSVIIPSSYENLSGWMTSGEVVLDKEGGGYGIAVRRTVGTSSITPSNFDGTLHVQEQGIYTDGTPEVLTVGGANLLNDATNITGIYIDSWGHMSPGSDAQYTDLIPVNEGETYVFSLVSGRDSGKDRLHGYNANGQWVKQIVFVDAAGQQGNKISKAVTIDSGISYVRLSYGITDTEAMIEKGATATDYQPYVPPQTASVPMLLSVGDVKDEVELISGGVKRKVGVKVLDGTETFSKSSAYGKAFLLNAAYAAWGADKTKAVLCTHFLGLPQKSSAQDDNTCFFNSTGHFYFRVTDNSDTDAFKAWLAAQYAAGTPVIVFFVLAEETTEQTTPHSLNSYEGTTVVDAQTNVDPVTLSAEYAATS